MDIKLLQWHYIQHDRLKRKISVKEFKEKAKSFSSVSDFKASKGWLEKFKKRYHLELK